MKRNLTREERRRRSDIMMASLTIVWLAVVIAVLCIVGGM